MLEDMRFHKVIIKDIIKIRNKISHGVSFKIEFSSSVIETRRKMSQLIHQYIIRKIKEMCLIGLKNNQFIPCHIILKDTKSGEVMIQEMDEYNHQRDKHYDRHSTCRIYSKEKIMEIAEKKGINKRELDYILYYSDS